ncbi:MAG: thioredoxin family protein [Desulfobacteraceae bacterium]|nr:thioredoxin family protein [Desulfobacteraceae bacterium]
MDIKQFQLNLKGKIALVDFSASWCGPCKAMEPVIKGMVNKFRGKATIVEVDIDTQKTLATYYMVQSIPTLIIFQEGQEVKRFVGVQSEDILELSLNEVIGNSI